MSYQNVESRLVTTLRLAAGFSCNEVAANDWRGLASGRSHAVVVSQNGHDREQVTTSRVQDDWFLNIDLYERWTGDQSSAMDNLHTSMQALQDQVDNRWRLDQSTGVLFAAIEDFGPVESYAQGRAQYLHLPMICHVREINTPTKTAEG